MLKYSEFYGYVERIFEMTTPNFEETLRFENIKKEFHREQLDWWIDEMIYGGIQDHYCISHSLIAIIDLLIESGLDKLEGFYPKTAAEVQMLAELVNLRAKQHNTMFYQFKPFLVRLALEWGADGGWDEHDGTFNLITIEAGVNCFHDPFGEIPPWLNEEQNNMHYKYAWSGVRRQNWSYEIIVSHMTDQILRNRFAYATRPGRTAENRSESTNTLLSDAMHKYRLDSIAA